MTELYVRRVKAAKSARLSRVYLGEKLLCHGLEDMFRTVKVPGETSIPAGRYRVTLRKVGGFHMRYSERFPWHQGMIWVRGVPGFKFILWHIGNFISDTEGCLLLGRGDFEKMAVWSSGATYARVYQLIAPMIASGDITHVTYQDLDR